MFAACGDPPPLTIIYFDDIGVMGGGITVPSPVVPAVVALTSKISPEATPR